MDAKMLDEQIAEPFRCCGCGLEAPDLVQRCDCITQVAYRRGVPGSEWMISPDEAKESNLIAELQQRIRALEAITAGEEERTRKAVEDEREACAALAQERADRAYRISQDPISGIGVEGYAKACVDLVRVIRARSTQP